MPKAFGFRSYQYFAQMDVTQNEVKVVIFNEVLDIKLHSK